MTETTGPLKIVTHDKFCIESVPSSCGVVIFGASGDLSHRKLIPALFDLHKSKLLPKGFFILGFARSDSNDEVFRDGISRTLKEKGETDAEVLNSFLKLIYYRKGQYANTADLKALQSTLKELGEKHKTNGNELFYLATPPDLYRDTIFAMSEAGLIRESNGGKSWSRVVVEKPFGRDLESACQLNKELRKVLDESQIYRIDHYLGKETVQNILMFRFANSIFEPVWNHQYIDHVQITAAESSGVGHRAGYYEKAGALRDMFQNHMFQLLALVAIEPPIRFDAHQYRDEKERVVQSLRPIPAGKLNDFVVRGQYTSGEIKDEAVPAYRDEAGVSKDSNIETFTAMKLFIDNWRWEGVPFYLRSGKRLENSATEIAVQFKTVPHSIFEFLEPNQYTPNVLSFRIQPDEGISLNFEAKHPGPKTCMATLNLRFNYKETFHEESMNAYVRLLLDCMQGDQTLFVRQDMIDLSWEFLSPILKEWEKEPVPTYKAGSLGPKAGIDLIEKDGRSWRPL